jgi:hypothetical protein
MAGNCIIITKPNGPKLISPGVVSVLDASGFDTVTARYIAQTTASLITAAKAPGTAQVLPEGIAANTNMIFMGISDCADLPGQCCEYTMTWRGLLTAVAGRNKKISKTRSVRERLFDSITGIPNSGGAVKARILELQAGLSVRSIHTGTEPDAPALDGAATLVDGYNPPGRGYNVIGATPTWCYPHGWVCYSWQSEEPIPGIWFVSAEYKFEQQTTSG